MAIMSNVKVEWAKVLGEPREKYKSKEREWTVDLLFSKDQIKELAKQGFTPDAFIKDGRYTARRNEKKADGSNNRPFLVLDETGKPWPNDKLIGNGSVVDIKYNFTDPYTHKGEKRVKLVLQEMCVREHVPYEGKGEQFDFVTPTANSDEDEW